MEVFTKHTGGNVRETDHSEVGEFSAICFRQYLMTFLGFG